MELPSLKTQGKGCYCFKQLCSAPLVVLVVVVVVVVAVAEVVCSELVVVAVVPCSDGFVVDDCRVPFEFKFR